MSDEENVVISAGRKAILDRYLQRMSNAGKKGGRSRSENKRRAAQANLAKARVTRHHPVVSMPVQEGDEDGRD